MTKRKFDIGDRVVGNGFESSMDLTGLHGVIVGFADWEHDRYAVGFDEYSGVFHRCGGLTDDGHGWFCDEDVLLPEEEVRVEIGARLPELALLLM